MVLWIWLCRKSKYKSCTCNELCNLYFQHIFTKHLFTFLFNMSRKTQIWNWFNVTIILRGTMYCSMMFYNFYSIGVLVLLCYQWSVDVFIVAFGLENFLENNVYSYISFNMFLRNKSRDCLWSKLYYYICFGKWVFAKNICTILPLFFFFKWVRQ
jgi:hypothetical protein